MAERYTPRTRSVAGGLWLARWLLAHFRGSARGAVMLEHIVLVGSCALVAILAWNRFGHTLNQALHAEADHVRGTALPAGVSLEDDLNALLAPVETGCVHLQNGQSLCVGGDQLSGPGGLLGQLGQSASNLGAAVGGLSTGSASGSSSGSGSLSTDTDEAVFWSGIAGSGSAAVARAWAATHGGSTMEMVMAQRGAALPEWDPNDPTVVTAWENASREFARGARGNVRVLLTGPASPGSVFSRVELPALRANQNVTSVIAVDPYTGAETVLWSR